MIAGILGIIAIYLVIGIVFVKFLAMRSTLEQLKRADENEVAFGILFWPVVFVYTLFQALTKWILKTPPKKGETK